MLAFPRDLYDQATAVTLLEWIFESVGTAGVSPNIVGVWGYGGAKVVGFSKDQLTSWDADEGVLYRFLPDGRFESLMLQHSMVWSDVRLARWEKGKYEAAGSTLVLAIESWHTQSKMDERVAVKDGSGGQRVVRVRLDDRGLRFHGPGVLDAIPNPQDITDVTLNRIKTLERH